MMKLTEIKQFQNLKFLDIISCNKHRSFPEFGNMKIVRLFFFSLNCSEKLIF